MSIEVIDEYLAIAEHCISTRKSNGGLYGYPCVLLLFTVIDALSNYMGHGENSFLELKTIFPSLTTQQVKNLKEWYRHLPAHQAIIMPGTQLSDETTGTAIDFGSKGEPTHIRVIPFCHAVKAAWVAFDRNRVSPTFDINKAPKNSIATSTSIGTTSSPLPGASGYYVTSTLRKP
jgi:hypothetical protein